MLFNSLVVFLNSFRFYFTGGRRVPSGRFHISQQNVQFMIGKYAYHNGYVDFSTNLTTKGFESKSVTCILSTTTEWCIRYIVALQCSYAQNPILTVSEWVIKFNGLFWTADIGLHVVHTSRVITTYPIMKADYINLQISSQIFSSGVS